MSEYEQSEASPEISEKRWYRVRVPSAHTPKRGSRHNLYIFAGDVAEALTKAQGLRGWKRDVGRQRFPDIHELDGDETKKLLEVIETEGVSLDKAQMEGFHGRRDNIEIY